MRTKVFKSNIAFGVLMAFVLTLGVQGSADAISRLTRNAGDLQTVTAGRDYQIRFTVTLQSSRRGSDYTNHAQTPAANIVATAVADKTNKTTYYLDDYNPDDANTVRGYQSEEQATYDMAHDYEQESIAIEVSGGAIKKVASHDLPANSTTLAMYESTHNSYSTTSNPHQRLSGSVTLTLTAPATAAVVTITIDPTTDGPTGHIEPADLEFTIYVVGPLNAGGTTEVVAGTNGVVRVSDQRDTPINGHFTQAANEPVYYTVEGSGRLYVSVASDRRTPSTNNLYTSSSAPVYLDTTGGSSKVTAYIAGSSDAATVLYIFSGGTLSALPKIEITGGNNQTGAPNGRLDDYFEVKVTDGKRRPVSGLPVTFGPSSPTGAMFIPVPGTKVDTATPTAASIDAEVPTATVAAATLHVQTDRNGVAKIYYQLSPTSGLHTVPATAYGVGTTDNPLSATLRATASTTARARVANLEIVSGNNQSAAKGEFLTDDLVVIVRSLAGHRIQDVIVQFRTTTGTLVPSETTTQPATVLNQNLATNEAPNPHHPRSGQQIYVETGPNGEAGVTYNIGQLVQARDVVAEIREEAQLTTQYDFAIDRVVFNVNGRTGTGGGTGGGTLTPPAPTNRIGLTLSSTTGEPGDEITVTVRSDPSIRTVTLSSADFANSLFSPQSGTTPFQSTLTLPDTDGEYDISAQSFPLTAATASVTVETGILGAISITPIGQPSGGAQSFSIGIRDTDGNLISGALTVRVSGSGFTTRNVETLNGIGNARLTLPTAAALYTLTASATDYTSGTTQVRIAGTTPTTDTTTTTTTTPTTTTTTTSDTMDDPLAPSSLQIGGQATRTGTANEALDAPLLVQVLDANDDPVANARVIFRVRTGQGRLSERGNGRATTAETDTRGYARANYTPMSASSTVEAEVRGVSRAVTFTITTSGGSATQTTTTPRDTSTGTTATSSQEINPVVQVAAANRPPMLWIDSGEIYALVGTTVKKFTSGVQNAQNLAIGGNKVYWTEQTGDESGTINSANLDGSNAKELASIKAVPYGIAVDTENSKLYWTNSRHRIQSANLDGSRIRNVLENLGTQGFPTDLTVDRGIVYWTMIPTHAESPKIGVVNPTARGVPKYISTGSKNIPKNLVVSGGKVYWTEETGEWRPFTESEDAFNSDGRGTINSANLNGAGAKELKEIRAVPSGIAVDAARSKLYWTNSRGRIQNADLDGSGVQTVVDGLASPGDMVLSNSIKAPTGTSATTTAGKSKYDINGDGSVDSTDVDALLLVVLAELTDAKYDVNGDGAVDAKDIRAVNANLDAGAAGAPTLLGKQFNALEVSRLQEQIELLIATGDRSPAAIKTLIYLQQLIALARPEKTQLLANYPNPFNPETWIPYELATDTNVKITIYSSTGVVVRTLQFGYQSAGYYTDRERAAYWDGKNAQGEQVASGVYFYQLETDTISSLRKMVILK